MRLSLFILDHIPDILREWDSFARTLKTPGTMTELALRDHAKQILEAIALDMASDESAREQFEKSRGLEPVDVNSAASTHGTLRHVSGFSLIQLTSEYRALRATVLRLWLPRVKEFDAGVAQDMVRFNETIDQALAESVLTYSDQGAHTRDTFLAILGHDLRSPLSTVTLAAHMLAKQSPTGPEVARIAVTLQRSARSMTAMVNDLLAFARLQLGGPIPVYPELQDLGPLCEEVLAEARASHPDCRFELEATGELTCNVDAPRMNQVLANLLNNAAQYSTPGAPVLLRAQGSMDAVVLQVRNFGPVIPEASLLAIFEPLVQLATDEGDRGRPGTSIGLGLYIAREMTLAHGGTIEASSSASEGTMLSLRLPRMLSGQELGRINADRTEPRVAVIRQ
jgi:signal transduction histidine kinase